MHDSSIKQSDAESTESTESDVAAERAGDTTPASPPARPFGLKVRTNLKAGSWEWN